ncbi:MAG: enoyl-CoA hydratase [Actinobacteria bacterium]|nr:enoyl-CoA hydratase [Actinomycetota bacterium]
MGLKKNRTRIASTTRNGAHFLHIVFQAIAAPFRLPGCGHVRGTIRNETRPGGTMSTLDTGTNDLLARIEGHVAIISFNRPEARTSTEQGINRLRTIQRQVSLAIRRLPQPVVASFPGAAAGAGLSIGFAADLRIAAERAIIVTAFANIGASGDFGTSWFLPRIVGEAKAKELMFMSPRLSARDALSLNIVNAVLPDENYEHAALEWCHELASRAPVALQYIKQNINRSLEVSLETALDAEAVAMVRTMGTADHREASAAFVEKRPAKFTGN